MVRYNINLWTYSEKYPLFLVAVRAGGTSIPQQANNVVMMQVLLNEVAPRPHNSGHYTIEACYVSQYEQHLRAVLGLPLGDPSMKVPAALMYNLLGTDEV
jgi:formate-dependent phosphoribosylglycinamide formyltransferase (GAR transformylase)